MHLSVTYMVLRDTQTFSKTVRSAEIRMWHIDYVTIYTLYLEHFAAMI
jgi:hypothetical protein